MQSKKHSMVEALMNVAIGFGVMLAAQLVIFPAHGIYIGFSTNLSVGAWFTAVSVIRTYGLRRLFNKYTGQTP